ncbi:site-specific integrase [Methylosinus sp. PW1]|uniref:site-specific integrase n=1 Tax=Methylosinus sp. PW1 TaxID=107636 RepID=UPI001AEC3971|nr:site-specific integrase [Methylosinus sp. PW1]
MPVETPPGQSIPLIVLDTGQILYEAWYFFRADGVRGHSSAWFEKAARFIGSFYDYFRATHKGSLGDKADADAFIDNCMSAFAYGTVQPDGTDPTGLFWEPWMPSKLAHARSVLKDFCRTVTDLWGEKNPLSASRFALATSSAFAREQKQRHSKLFHLSFRDAGNHGKVKPLNAARGAIVARRGSAKVFPRRLIGPLLFEGCLRTRQAKDFGHPIANKYNLTLMMALTLIAGAGLRKSEIFHMFVDDVRTNRVHLYDPVLGQISWRGKRTGKLVSGQRTQYLAEQFGRTPRSKLPYHDSEHAGWKSMLLDHGEPDFYAVAHWMNGRLRSLFYHLYRIYRDHVRPTGLDHPYLFVSLSHLDFGRPWSIGAFNEAFEAALDRIGETPDANRGLNPHGLRHLYGQTLVDMSLPPVVIQQAMHHKSIESQLVYTKPSFERIKNMLDAASNFDSDNDYVIPPNNGILDYHWKSDPLNLFAHWNT